MDVTPLCFSSVWLSEVTVKPRVVLYTITQKDTDTNMMTTDHHFFATQTNRLVISNHNVLSPSWVNF